jgi:hypothetical protein
LEKANANSSGAGAAGTGELAKASFNSIVAASSQALQRQVEIQLNWSEYFQGKWTTRESGGFGNPIRATVSSLFDKGQVLIHVIKDYEDGEERACKVNLSGAINKAFRVVSKNGFPEIVDGEFIIDPLYSQRQVQTTQQKVLQVNFTERIETQDGEQKKVNDVSKDILQQGSSFSLLFSSNPSFIPQSILQYWVDPNNFQKVLQFVSSVQVRMLVSPFFYQDNRHTFFVEPTLTETTIDRWEEWVVTKPKGASKIDDGRWRDIPIQPVEPRKPIPIPDPIDPRAKFPLNPGRDWVTNPSTVLQIGETLIGQMGRLDLAILPEVGNVTQGIGGAILQGRGSANIQLAGELASVNPNISLNVIDSGGLNSALLENLSANLNTQNINLRMSDRMMPL